MDDSPEKKRLADELLNQDLDLNGDRYKEYRMQLDLSLKTAERREKIVGRIVVASLVVAIAGMFAGGTRLVGSFDPGDKDATVLSVVVGFLYVSATVTFYFSLATYFSRYRPNVRKVKEQIRDANIQLLRQEVNELKQQIATLQPRQPTVDQ